MFKIDKTLYNQKYIATHFLKIKVWIYKKFAHKAIYPNFVPSIKNISKVAYINIIKYEYNGAQRYMQQSRYFNKSYWNSITETSLLKTDQGMDIYSTEVKLLLFQYLHQFEPYKFT